MQQALTKIARDVHGVQLVADENDPLGNSFIYTPDNHKFSEVCVHRQIFNWRLSEFTPGTRLFFDRHWCYEGGDINSYMSAVAALKEWQGDRDGEPVGWIKAWDGRRGTHSADK